MSRNKDFSKLGLPELLADKLKKDNITIPTDIQSAMIPLVLGGRDVIGQSPTGTGKTLAYLLPILARLAVDQRVVQSIILVPGRELAMQVKRLAHDLMGDMGVAILPIIGGANIDRQIEGLKLKPQLVVGTPGRILELIRKRKINSQTVKTVVIDEADKMWKLGFKEDVLGVIKTTLRDRQIVLVSATISPEVVAASMEIMKDPELVNLSQERQIASDIEHIYFMAQEKNKAETLRRLLSIYEPRKAVIFINSNQGVKPFVRRFVDLGLASEGLHSELSPQERKAVLERFSTGRVPLLVATDIFARGMDVKGIDIVFNFDLPTDSQHYLHRVGRTGRAGSKGLAISFVTPEQKFIMSKYEDQLDIKIQEYGIGEREVFPVKKKAGKKAVR